MPTQNFKVGEMVNKRTPNSKTWMNFDGSYTTEIYSGIVHYEDENGNLQNINTDIMDEANLDLFDFPVSKHSKSMVEYERTKAKNEKSIRSLNHDDFDFQAPLLPFSVQIPRNITKGYSVGQNEQYIRFVPQNASPSKGFVEKEKQNVIRYQDVWNDADVILEVNETGVKETIILKAEKAPSTFTFEITEGAINDDGTFDDLKLLPAWLVDANGTKRDVEQTVRREDDKTYIDLVADVTDLVFPVEIDPTVTISSVDGWEDTQADKNNPDTKWGTSTSLSISAYAQGPYRIYAKFNMSLPSNAVITKAELSFVANKGMYYNDGNMNIATHRVTGSWSESTLTWNTQPTFTSTNKTVKTVSSEDVMTLDFKNIAQDWVNGQVNNGVVIKADIEDGTVSVGGGKTFYSSEYSGTTNRPSAQITYNNPPTTPTVTVPNGGEKWNSLHTITWNQSTDADGNPITYEIQLTTNNGSTWKTIKTGVTGGSTTFDFINEPETSTAKIRIRAFDGTSYSAYDESNGVFTIDHNYAPTIPTNLSPSGGQVVDVANVIRLSWKHNDTDNDPQAKYELQWRLQGNATWNTVSATTVNQYFDAIANYFPTGTIEWRVRTYDQAGLVSPYSNIAVFFVGIKPDNPTIVSPINGEIISIAKPTVQWSSVGQVGYHLKVLDTNNALLWEEIVATTNKAVTIGYTLANNTAYILQLSIKNADGLYSEFVSVAIDVSYTPPQKTLLSISSDSNSGAIILSINNPEPVGTEPIVLHNDVYKRKLGESNFIRIATNIVEEYIDYAVASGVVYEYFVRAIADNGTYADSDVLNDSVEFKDVRLHLVSNPNEFVVLRFNGSRTFKTNFVAVQSEFAGRNKPVTEFGEMINNNLSLSYLVKQEDIHKFEGLLYKRDTMLYRDSRGRKLYVIADSYTVKDVMRFDHFEVDLPLYETDYTEEV